MQKEKALASIIDAYGGELVNLMADEQRLVEIKQELSTLASFDLSLRQMNDLELLLVGAFSPLRGFMNQQDYQSCCEQMRLGDGTLWPLPITLDVPAKVADGLQTGSRLALRDPEGVALAILTIEDTYQPDRAREAKLSLGTDDPRHPGVERLLERSQEWYLGGQIEGIALPAHYDFGPLRRTPAELRQQFAKRGWRKVLAVHSSSPMHRCHYELCFRAVREQQANLLVHPVVGTVDLGDLSHYTRVRCYQALMPRFPRNTALLSLLPLATRKAGPKEALLHGIIRRNYGCSHLLIGPGHAEPEGSTDQEPFYPPYAAQQLFAEHEAELGIASVPMPQIGYVEEKDSYLTQLEAPEGAKLRSLSVNEMRTFLDEGRKTPAWYSYPEVMQELEKAFPPRNRQGFCVFFSGLSGAGKSTIANVLRVRLLEIGTRPLTLLDGDIVRKNLSSELGFSREHRDINILRIAFVASEITKNGGIAICAPIAPYRKVRKQVRSMISARGGYILVHVATPLDICEGRDRKGMYQKARAGIIKNFTGVSDPYELPQNPDLTIDTSDLSPEEAAQQVILFLEKQGYIA